MKFTFTNFALSAAILLSASNTHAEIYVKEQSACGTYSAKAVYQFRSQKIASCGFSGGRWSEDGAGQHNWCRTVRPAITEGETKARGIALMKCFNPRSSININDLHLEVGTLNNQLLSAANRGALERMQQLIAAGADLQSNKHRLMSYAINSKQRKVVAFMKRFGTPMGGAGNNPLNGLIAYYYDDQSQSDLQFLEWLIKNGVNVNHTDSNGDTPLSDAIHRNNYAVVNLLLRYRANVHLDIQGGQCKTVMPLDLAIDKGNEQIIHALRQAGARSQAQCSR